MPMITIDPNICRKDGICATHCPMGIIQWDKGHLPFIPDNRTDHCIQCGHCVAICSTDALTHQAMAPEDCPRVSADLTLSLDQTRQFMRSRRSIRHFKSGQVDQSTLEALIELAAHAPSGHNCQPALFQVVSGKEKVRTYAQVVVDWMVHTLNTQAELAAKLHLEAVVKAWHNGRDLIACNAPHLILVNGHGKNPMAPIACTIAAAYLDLAAPSFGVGTCWLGYFRRALVTEPGIRESLGLASELRNHAVLAAGHPLRSYHRMPKRRQPIINWIQ